MRSGLALLLACSTAALLARPAMGQGATTEGRLREALRAATEKVHALEREREKQAAGEAALRQELETLRGRLAAAVRGAERPSQVAELKARLAAEAEAGATAAARLEQCQAASGASVQEAKAWEDERARLAGEVTSLRERLARSDARNARLYAIGKDILAWLDRLGFGAALAAREPFLGVKRVELENAAMDFEDELLEQKGGNGPEEGRPPHPPSADR